MSLKPPTLRRIIAAAFVLLAALALTAPALAQDGDDGGDVVIDENAEDDLYLFGDTITINADVDGDVVAVGRAMVVNGTISGDLIYAGQSLVLNGTVQDDVRVAGMVLVFEDSSLVEDDLVAAGYAVEMRPGSHVGGNLMAAGSQVLVGDVDGEAKLAANGVRLSGAVAGDVRAEVGGEDIPFNPMMWSGMEDLPAVSTIPGGLSFGEGGQIGGDLNYSGPREAIIPQDAVGGQTHFELDVEEADRERDTSVSVGYDAVPDMVRYVGYFTTSFLLLLGLGALLQRYAPNFVGGTLGTLRTRPLASLGVGVLGLIAYWGLIVLLFLLVIVVVLPLIIFGAAGRFFDAFVLIGTGAWTGFEALTRWLAPLLIALLVGEWLYGLINRERKAPFWSMALGLAVVMLLLAIPFLGRFLLAGMVALFGLGAVILHLWPKRAEPAAVVAAPAPAEKPAPAKKTSAAKPAAKSTGARPRAKK